MPKTSVRRALFVAAAIVVCASMLTLPGLLFAPLLIAPTVAILRRRRSNLAALAWPAILGAVQGETLLWMFAVSEGRQVPEVLGGMATGGLVLATLGAGIEILLSSGALALSRLYDRNRASHARPLPLKVGTG